MNWNNRDTRFRLIALTFALIAAATLWRSLRDYIGAVFALWGWSCWWLTQRQIQAQTLVIAASAEVPTPTLEIEALTERCTAAEEAGKSLQEQMTANGDRLEWQTAQIEEQNARITELTERMEQAEARAQESALREQEALDRLQAVEAESERFRQRVAILSEDLAGQVIVSLAEAEQAISSAIEAFTRIAGEAQSAAEIAQNTVGKSGENNVSDIAVHATDVMGMFIQMMIISTRKIAEASRQLQQMVAVSHSLAELLDDIEGVADQTGMLALNASIEAARAGQYGRAFGVVAAEVRKLAERSRQAAERMRTLTQETTRSTETIYTTLASTAETSMEASCEAQGEVNRLLQTLQNADQATQEVMEMLSAKSENITTNYASIITAFQFHDLLRQRLEHVADPLVALSQEIGEEAVTEIEPKNKLAYAVGESSFSARAVGAAPTLEIVSYESVEAEDDNVTLF